MKLYTTLMASCAFAFAAASAQADCAADLARLTGETEGSGGTGMAGQDHMSGSSMGSSTDAAAHMTTGSDSTGTSAGDSSPTEGIAKDGSLAPLEEPGGDQTTQAMSGQDAQAQQAGEPTAAQEAQAATGSGSAPDATMATDATPSNTMSDTAAGMESSTETSADIGAGITAEPDMSTSDADAGSEGTMTDSGSSDTMPDTGSNMATEGSEPAMDSSMADATTDSAPSATGTAQDGTSQTSTMGSETGMADAGAADSMMEQGGMNRDAVIQRARMALAAGDEEACRAAVEELEAM